MNDKNLVKELHPCFGSVKNKGRIHLPVCPNCNIQCNFCDRKINDYENRPGVTAIILEPSEALDVIEKSLELCPDITVAGIAGPGDTLASNKAIETFRLIKDRFPNLLKCMSTNGLLLHERADELIELGIDTLTVTVNAVDSNIQSKIVSKILYHGQIYDGKEAAEILIQNQLQGIKKVSKQGITIKVNTVLIKEINKDHIKDIAKAIQEAGASMYNIIPLIPQHKLINCKAPECIDIDKARREAEKYIDVFRHCKRCRADAIGIPGKLEVSDQVYKGFTLKETFSHG
ncbi:MAG: nifB [Anaerocolumna sp.]|jgi:nitrogen fixation protein NifB|nr:nifB [Anaerocolumna sp.]